MIAVNLRVNQMKNPVGMTAPKIRLSWVCQGGIRQSAYEVKIREGERLLWESGKVASSENGIYPQLGLVSRQRLNWQVRLWDETDAAGEWSEEAYVETGLMSADDWKASWINPETEEGSLEVAGDASDTECDDINRMARDAWEQGKHKKGEVYVPHRPASYLRRTFRAQKGEAARLYITCRGLYEAWLNGRRVGDWVLMPGCSNYHFELPCQTYDVTDLIREGENELLVVLGDGWYRSTSGVDGDRFLFGEELGLLCQLEVDASPVLVSDVSWQASQCGPLRQNDMQQGEVYDARLEKNLPGGGLSDSSLPEGGHWHGVRSLEEDMGKLTGMNTVPIVEQESFAGRLFTAPNGETVIDFGQNIAGYVEFVLTAKEGEKLVLTHGETLDENGNFTAENFQDRSRHKENGTYQMVSYICKEGENHYKARFTIMGFRYAKVETDIDLTGAQFTAHAVYSRMEQTATFTCGNEDVNRLVENSIWSQKGNFCDIPTDCPTRERAGWTGDAGLYVETGLTLMDSYSVYRKWLAQCRFGQYPDGKLSNIAPPNSRGGFMTALLCGSVGWGDAGIIVPYAMYQRYGDEEILRENYGMMKGWYAFLEGRAGKTDVKHLIDRSPYKKYAIMTGIDYGEWCEPGSDPMSAMKNGNYDVATAYLAYSGRLLSEIAEILGEEADAAHYREVSEMATKAFVHYFTKDGIVESQRQCQYVRPVQLNLVSKNAAAENIRQLNEMVKAAGYHLNTGFLTTPALCRVLCDYGYVETAYRLLLQDTAPGWLYEVKQGATTMWETWNGIDAEGRPHESLNHYSYGAVTGWLIQGVCGIRLRGRNLTLQPVPHQLLGHAEAAYDSPAGRIESRWRYEGDTLVLDFVVPSNVQADIVLPDGRTCKVEAGTYHYEI